MKITKPVADLLSMPPVKWAGQFDLIAPADLDEKRRQLDQIAIEAARLAKYMTYRSYGSDHDDAVNRSNKAAVAVAAALGFSYPDGYAIHF